MRTRVRDVANVDYQVARKNDTWPDHVARILVTAGLGTWEKPARVLDPACGDGTIVLQMHQIHPFSFMRFADISEPCISALSTELEGSVAFRADVSDITSTLLDAKNDEPYDLVVLTEILEHVDDPVAILRMAKEVSKFVIASSPLIMDGKDDNPEHLWAFDGDGYRELFEEAGWFPYVRTILEFREFPYTFQIWMAR